MGTTSTLGNVRPAQRAPRSLVGRRFGTAVLALVVVLGLFGQLGDSLATRTASAGGYTVTVEYARTARAGLDVPWTVTVESEHGFDGPLTLAVTGDYFTIYEAQGRDPMSRSETVDGEFLYWTFDPPPGRTFRVDFDAYVQPSAQIGASGTVAVVVDGEHIAPVEFTTTLFP